MAKQSLGKGFDALIPKSLDPSLMEEDHHRVQKLLISDITPNPDQPRREFDKNAHLELTTSVKRFGVLQPIIVIRSSKGYRIVAGERRWRAAKDANLSHIPAIVKSLKELEQVELALIENIQRVDLSPFEQALSVYRLQHHFNMPLDQISKRLGKAHSTISNLSRLLHLPEDVLLALREGKISEGHARTILALKKYPKQQTELLRCIIDNKWSVRQAEQYVYRHKQGVKGERISSKADMEQTLSKRLETKVQIKETAKGGQLIISFKSSQQLKKIIEQL